MFFAVSFGWPIVWVSLQSQCPPASTHGTVRYGTDRCVPAALQSIDRSQHPAPSHMRSLVPLWGLSAVGAVRPLHRSFPPTTSLPTSTTANTTSKTVTFWTWYTTTIYFLLSATSAYLCWREIGNCAAAAAGLHGTAQNGGQSATADTPGVGEIRNKDGVPVPPLLLQRLQLVTWNVACLGSLVVVTIYWFADVSQCLVFSHKLRWYDLVLNFSECSPAYMRTLRSRKYQHILCCNQVV